ncbi:methyltransferase domain-containing protein [Flavilitoribacter nigricans]|uniref:Methyltransferase domain-containing protein n=1 Tax=Flavilitoribacter nigricans (strain ATCC 23147 / DSM 23189 / NBRC 102662 / NCIMB 1420 / SS-2) TaxID=1122177 RepID=A0A2D0N5G2_FLAN2|nr:methyltransferase domain-containing protein [Flavilitoribacter nigricans]PHN03626.1 hypothetical protein CRP01_25545 [Flavilitoribacter nigricans DSM 23189 = NBRC 102662]
MKSNKHIERDGKETSRIFNNRTLDSDYRHLKSILQPGMRILDVGCGTGALSSEMALMVGDRGRVTGIDNTEKFIESGRDTYGSVTNLELVHADLFEYTTDTRFDLITSARTLQWLSDPKRALLKMKHLLRPNGRLSILDYNHEAIEWVPEPPQSMRQFYTSFLRWRADAGMNNRIADDLPDLLRAAGFSSVELHNSDEHYHRERPDFSAKVGIWSKVAGSTQMVEEAYIDDATRLQAISDYDQWVADRAVSMTMKLNEVRGIKTTDSIAIDADTPFSSLARSRGIASWDELVHCVRNLSYGRNETRGDLSLVLREGRGTCSSKHALLKKIADENQLEDVQLILGMYRMNAVNTPGIGTALDDYPLDFIPEAHCYLQVRGERLDATGPNSEFARIGADVISEREIQPEEVSDFKVRFHQDFIKAWLQEGDTGMSFDEVWSVREQCIQNLAQKRR